MNLNVHEIFATVQGEGYDTGLPCIFVRLYGCNVKCSYCDQPQCPKTDAHRMSIDKVMDSIRKYRCKYVCITGGEPLIQPSIFILIYELIANGFKVSIETNGTIPLEDDDHRKFKYVMDVKCPSSGVTTSNCYNNLKVLHMSDEVKFVVADRADYEFMKRILNKYPTKAKILVSPVFDYNNKQSIAKDLVEWLLEDHLFDVKLQLQIHKFIDVK